jgi:hypothetical protein
MHELSLKLSRGAVFYICKDDLDDLKEKVIVWTVVGWVYDFTLWKKDHSQCLNDDLSVAFNFR